VFEAWNAILPVSAVDIPTLVVGIGIGVAIGLLIQPAKDTFDTNVDFDPLENYPNKKNTAEPNSLPDHRGNTKVYHHGDEK
jgi:hypothetical protein